jgi:SAM-dependent methyltransferase
MGFENPTPLHTDRRRASSFGEAAEDYDRVRPPYPAEMVDVLLAEAPTRVLDVGCGTGIAARLFATRGCDVLGLEPDPRMAAVAARQGTVVEEGNFEAWDPQGRVFDLLIAGQAWHWVDPDLGAHKAATVLRPGGRIGLFWNQAFPDAQSLQAMQPAYLAVAPHLAQNSVLIGRRDEMLYESIAQAIRRSGHFGDVEVRSFGHDAVYSTDEWLTLASTHSDHHTLPPAEREELLGQLRVAIDGSGGQVPVRYQTSLVTGCTLPA